MISAPYLRNEKDPAFESNESALDDLNRSTWDAVVIGAGVAGTLAAILLSRAGRKVLLVEAKTFPREKVCGCCLNRRGQAVLDRHGLLEPIKDLGARPIDRMSLSFGASRFDWDIPQSLSTSRSIMDQWLVDAAVTAGATFIDSAKASVLSDSNSAGIMAKDAFGVKFDCDSPRIVSIKRSTLESAIVATKLVIAADGLTQSSLLQLPEFESKFSSKSKIGLHCFLPADTAIRSTRPNRFATTEPASQQVLTCEKIDELRMLVGPSGYVGLVPVEDGRIDLAAAVDPNRINRHQRPADVVRQILRDCQFEVSCDLHNADWLSTPALTRRSTRCGSQRILVVGDALGYVEPFTGEGMSWALAAAEEMIPIALAAISHWSDTIITQWETTLRKKARRNQWMCQATSRLIRYPRLANMLAQACQRLPPVRHAAMRWTSEI